MRPTESELMSRGLVSGPLPNELYRSQKFSKLILSLFRKPSQATSYPSPQPLKTSSSASTPPHHGRKFGCGDLSSARQSPFQGPALPTGVEKMAMSWGGQFCFLFSYRHSKTGVVDLLLSQTIFLSLKYGSGNEKSQAHQGRVEFIKNGNIGRREKRKQKQYLFGS